MTSIHAASVILAVGLPLFLAVGMLVPHLRGFVAASASWCAAVPALVLVLLPDAATVEESALLFGLRLYAPDALTRGFLLGASLLWFVSGRFASTYIAGSERRYSFWLFFLATMGGNIGVVLAQDIATFYLLYAVMTFAAYGLVLHERSGEARRAGRVYLVLALAGEVLLLAGFWLIAGVRTDLPLHEVPRAVATAPERAWILGLLLAGFGVKAGAVPLHVWLPLAHPVAPTPASAILSGALINAGLLGWLRFMPLGETALPELGAAVALVGVVTLFYGAVVGVTQRDAKTVLAYSSVSQMGIMITALGVALAAPTSAKAARAALVIFALHHSVAKGALFLGTAIAPLASAGWPKWLTRAGLVLPALAIAGAPLTSGAVAKAAIKAVLEGGPPFLHPLLFVLSIGAVGSTLLMARFLGITWPCSTLRDERPPRGLWVPWALLLCAGNTLFFIHGPHSHPIAPAIAIGKLWSASWPILVAVAVVYAVRRGRRSDASLVTLPAGDLVVVFERELQRIRVRLSATFERARARDWSSRVTTWIFEAARTRLDVEKIERTEARLEAFGLIGVLTILLLVGLLAPFVLQ